MTSPTVPEFPQAVEQMPSLLAALQAAASHRVADHPLIPAGPGIYLFSERDQPVCVGQSRKLRSRLKQHPWERSRENAASFALPALVGVQVGFAWDLPSMTVAVMAATVRTGRIDTAPAVGLDEDGLLRGAGVDQRSPAYLKGEGFALTDATVYWP